MKKSLEKNIIENPATEPSHSPMAQEAVDKARHDFLKIREMGLTPSLLRLKLCLVAKEIGFGIPHNADVTIGQRVAYTYTEAKIVTSLIGPALQRYGILPSFEFSVLPSLCKVELVQSDGKYRPFGFFTVNCVARFHNIENDEVIQSNSHGTGTDWGDKGIMKAETVAQKYALSRFFLAGLGIDPESAQLEDVPDGTIIRGRDGSSTAKPTAEPEPKKTNSNAVALLDGLMDTIGASFDMLENGEVTIEDFLTQWIDEIESTFNDPRMSGARKTFWDVLCAAAERQASPGVVKELYSKIRNQRMQEKQGMRS